MNNLVVVAVVIGVSVPTMVVGKRLGFFGPNSRAWPNALFGAIWGAVLAVAIIPVDDIRVTSPLVVVITALLGVIGGAIAGFLWSYFTSLDRRLQD